MSFSEISEVVMNTRIPTGWKSCIVCPRVQDANTVLSTDRSGPKAMTEKQ